MDWLVTIEVQSEEKNDFLTSIRKGELDLTHRPSLSPKFELRTYPIRATDKNDAARAFRLVAKWTGPIIQTRLARGQQELQQVCVDLRGKRDNRVPLDEFEK